MLKGIAEEVTKNCPQAHEYALQKTEYAKLLKKYTNYGKNGDGYAIKIRQRMNTVNHRAQCLLQMTWCC